MQLDHLPEAEGGEGVQESGGQRRPAVARPVQHVCRHGEAGDHEAREQRRLVGEDRVAGQEVDGRERREVAEQVLREGERVSRRVEDVRVEQLERPRDQRVDVPGEDPDGKQHVGRRRDDRGRGPAEERPGEENGGSRIERGRAQRAAPSRHRPPPRPQLRLDRRERAHRTADGRSTTAGQRSAARALLRRERRLLVCRAAHETAPCRGNGGAPRPHPGAAFLGARAGSPGSRRASRRA